MWLHRSAANYTYRYARHDLKHYQIADIQILQKGQKHGRAHCDDLHSCRALLVLSTMPVPQPCLQLAAATLCFRTLERALL